MADVAPLDTMMETFASICVSSPDITAQRLAASALPGVIVQRVSDYDSEKRVKRVPGINYLTQGMQIGVFGWKNANICSVATTLSPDTTAEAFITSVEARFKRKPHTAFSKGEFIRSGWSDRGRQFDLEWRRKDGNVIGLLSVRKKDGYS